MLGEFLEINVWILLMVMTRIGTMLTLIPGFGASYVTPRFRLGLTFAVGFLLLPVLTPYLPPLPDETVLMFLILAGEVVIGAFLATIASVTVAALQAAGTFISYFSSMANALVQDVVAEQQSSVVSGLLSTIGIVLIFVTDLHHLILRAYVESYSLFLPGQPIFFGDMLEVVARHVADAFALGLKMASPLLLVAMVYYLSLGVLGRLMPTLQVFFFGLPVQISLQIWVLMLSLSGIMMVFLQAFYDGYVPFLGQ